MERDSSSPTGRPKTIALFYLLMSALTLLTILVLGEVGARLFYTPHSIPEPPPFSSINPYRPNPYIVTMRPYIFFHIPGSKYAQKILSYTNEYSINSLGFRGDEFPLRPAENHKRLIILGDSIVEGHGVRVDQAFSSLLNQRLSATNWEVLGLGVQGASPIYFAANLPRYYLLHPDAALLVIHENDLHDDEIREKAYFKSPFMDNSSALLAGSKSGSILDKSMLYSLLHTTWRTLLKTPLEHIIEKNAKVAEVHADRKTQKTLSSFAIPADRFDQRWEMSEQYLDYALADMRNHDIKVMATSLCTVTLLFPAVRSYKEHCSSLEEKVRIWADKNSLPYLSLSDTVEDALETRKTKDVLIMNDFHPTPMTHGLLADTLLPFIRDNLDIETRNSDKE